MIETFGSDAEDACFEDGGPVVRGEVSESRAVDEGGYHLFGFGGGVEGGVVVAYGDGGNLCVTVC